MTIDKHYILPQFQSNYPWGLDSEINDTIQDKEIYRWIPERLDDKKVPEALLSNRLGHKRLDQRRTRRWLAFYCVTTTSEGSSIQLA